MKVKDGIKIYESLEDVREFPPLDGEFFVFTFENPKTRKKEIFVESFANRNHGQFWNIEDAFRYAKFRKQEGDINSLFEKYERLLDVLNKANKNLGLTQCPKCKNLAKPKTKCLECGTLVK